MLFSSSLTTDFLGITIALVAIIVLYYKYTFRYWKQRGVQTLPASIPFGNASGLILGTKTFGQIFQESYDYLKQNGLPYGGMYFFSQKMFIPINLEIVKNVMQKDFQSFINHGNYTNEEDDPFTGNLFNLADAKWRSMRVKLTPTFTSGKMKMMFDTLANCSVGLVDNINKYALEESPVDIKDVLGCFSTDVIGSCAFGIDCNTQKNPNSEFRQYGKKIFESSLREVLVTFLQFLLPKSFLTLIKFRTTDRGVENFFMNMVKNTVNYREQNNIYRKDFMHLLIQLKNMGKLTDDGKILSEDGAEGKQGGLSMNELAAQAFVFFGAGFETSSTTMTFALYEIGINSEIQKKLRNEIRDVLKKHDNKLCYDAIMEMSYLDKVVQETLRKYPPAGALFRECNQDYLVPDHHVKIEKGVMVAIPVLAIHHDHEYYPNPQVFDPERFNQENKASRPSFAWLPFGEGPRICIGLRFGLMQTKVGLVTLLNNFDISINRKTLIPLKFDPRSLILSTEGGVWLDFKKIN